MKFGNALRLLVVLVVLLGAAQVDAEVVIKTRPSPFEIRTDKYQALVDWDGCLTNLRIDDVEFLAAGVSISRGSYFYQGGPLRQSTVEQPTADVISAQGDAAAVRYRFTEERTVWTLENLTEQPMVFFLVFAKEVEAVRNQAGQLVRAPITEDMHQLTCFRGPALLTIQGLDRVWGPWEGSHQVAQVDLPPGERREIQLQVAQTTSDVRQEIAALVAPPPEQALTLLSPRPYQVIQRRTATAGELLISGRCRQEVDSIEVHISGKSVSGDLPDVWHTIVPVTSMHLFNHRLQLPAGGWYVLEARARRSGKVVAETTVDRFGVGEVFVGAGQSNSTNCGQFQTNQRSGMVSSFGGTDWQLADDPQPGAADKSQGGSFWPAFGDAMHAKYHVPIGVAVTGFGGTSVNQWQPDGDLFDWMMQRVRQLGTGGFRALLWHQGESDVGMSTDEYYLKLKHIITTSQEKAGWDFPWLVAQASYHNSDRPREESIRHAQQRLWEDGVALRGPDTDTLTGDHRDFEGQGIHFSPKGLQVHGALWAERVAVYLDEVLQRNVKRSN